MPDSSPHSRRFDRVEILNRLKAVEAGEMTLYERELVEQYEGAEKELDLTCKLLDERLAEITRLEEQVEALREECADWERGADEELARAWKERALASEEQLEAEKKWGRSQADLLTDCATENERLKEQLEAALARAEAAEDFIVQMDMNYRYEEFRERFDSNPASEPEIEWIPATVVNEYGEKVGPQGMWRPREASNTPSCPKCGTDDVLVRWHDRKKRGDYF